MFKKLILLYLVLYCQNIGGNIFEEFENDSSHDSEESSENEFEEASFPNFNDPIARRMEKSTFKPTKTSPLVYKDYAVETNCLNFVDYFLNCTSQAASIYSNPKLIPPPGELVELWCRSIKVLGDCASNWNEKCGDISEEKFFEDSIEGNSYVYKTFCKNQSEINAYKNVTCRRNIEEQWMKCNDEFLAKVEEARNLSKRWDDFDTHFNLCCLRAKVRRCTLDAIRKHCQRQDFIVMQRFSVVVSEAEVFKNCDAGVDYKQCPSGDPRPSRRELDDKEEIMMSHSKRNFQHRNLYQIVFMAFMSLFLSSRLT